MKIEILVPQDRHLLETLNIRNRIHPDTNEIQYLTSDIINRTIPFVPKDAFCMLSLTMYDLYPSEKWNYIFGFASYKNRTGVFSFRRQDPRFLRIFSFNPEQELLENACEIVVHEIGHMFGMHHCVYYECNMNGINSF